MELGRYLNTERQKKVSHGLKADRYHEVITYNPSTIKPGETLDVRIPKLDAHRVIVPGSLQLTFNLETTCLLYTSPSPRD